jgi:hypothetical protein
VTTVNGDILPPPSQSTSPTTAFTPSVSLIATNPPDQPFAPTSAQSPLKSDGNRGIVDKFLLFTAILLQFV